MIIEKQKGKQAARHTTMTTLGMIICQNSVAKLCKNVHPDHNKAITSKVHFQFKLSANYPITSPDKALVAVNVTPVIIPY